MDFLQIEGGVKLSGSVNISGAKNAALPLIASSLLSETLVTINNAPKVADVKTFGLLLEHLGATFEIIDAQIKIDTSKVKNTCANYDIVRKMRASILVLGPILARFGHCEVSLPGGCAIGQRPIDLHLKALEQMGATIEIKEGYVLATAPDGLRGTTIVFDKVTVTGSENIIMAAALAHGTTKLLNVAKEPEVVQLCEVLLQAGLNIEGIGTDKLIIHGTSQKLLKFPTIEVIPDRIEAATYLCAGAITNSKITIENARVDHLESVIAKLVSMGFGIEENGNAITILPTKKIIPVNIETFEYPGFPTDTQAQFMALATQANGASVIDERLFENRFMHASELSRMGANIKLSGHTATISGVTELTGTDVMATDLRASSALVLAGLCAKGITRVHRIYHLDRGYENLEGKLSLLGANIKRLRE